MSAQPLDSVSSPEPGDSQNDEEETSAKPKRTPRKAAYRPRLIDNLVRWQTTQPWQVLLVAAITVLIAALLASRLTLKTEFGELLPRGKESVRVAEEVNKRLPALSNLVVLVEGEDNDGLKRLVDALGPELRKIGKPLVGRVDFGVQDAQQFFERNQMLYAPLDLVQEVHDEIIERYEYEVALRTDALIDSDPNLAPAPLTEESIRKRLDERTKKNKVATEARKKFPDGY